jgi:hypothetical protein
MNLEDYNTMQMDLETRRRQIGNMEAQIQAFHDMDIFEAEKAYDDVINVRLTSAGHVYLEKMIEKHPDIKFKKAKDFVYYHVGDIKPVEGGNA